ncbi:MBG domain-containing protein [Halanaerobium hydrogeniformans]|uniref:Conserved repeat domain protein n=1 Tax=Halanaerobium hydrogeniformans TaxID=656519 RepID=E4RPI0_HALHG|nr:MBG domain-containing protein [Halanaerobium hydrogeniformans]ADQ14003.1 conserved repeat domain protein [Halanaerobium hydrogeniformans]
MKIKAHKTNKLYYIFFFALMCLLFIGITNTTPAYARGGSGDFRVSNYASGFQLNNFLWRGYAFTVSREVEVTHLWGGGGPTATGGFQGGIYETSWTGDTIGDGNPRLDKLLSGVVFDHTRDVVVGGDSGQEEMVKLGKSVTLYPGQTYFIAQGRVSTGSGTHYAADSIDYENIEIGSPIIDQWWPQANMAYQPGGDGTAVDAVGRTALSETPIRVMMGFRYITDVNEPSLGPEAETGAMSTGKYEAVLEGVLSDSGAANDEPTTLYFEYSTNSDLSNSTLVAASPHTIEGPATDVGFSRQITGLNDGTTYYYRAVAINEAGRSNGDIVSFVHDSVNFARTLTAEVLGSGGTVIPETRAVPIGESTTFELRPDSDYERSDNVVISSEHSFDSEGSWNGNVFTTGVIAEGSEENITLTFSFLKEQAITFEAGDWQSKTYGDDNFVLEATASSGLDVFYESSNPDVASIDGNTVNIHNAGTTTIIALQDGNVSYLPADNVERSLTVEKKAITIAADDISKYEGTDDPELSYQITEGNLESGDSLAVELNREDGEEPGNYAIELNTLDNPNYDITCENANFTIKPAYSVSIDQEIINSNNEENISFKFADGDVGADYDYIIVDENENTVEGNGEITETVQTISGINVSSLSDGILTLTVTLTDSAGNTGNEVTDQIDKETSIPTLDTVNIESDNDNNDHAKVGDKITLNFISSKDITELSITIADNQVSATDLEDNDATTWQAEYTMTDEDTEGEVVFVINYEDMAGNSGQEINQTTDNSSVFFSKTAPENYYIDENSINFEKETGLYFDIKNAEIDSSYNSIIRDQNGREINENGVVSSETQQITFAEDKLDRLDAGDWTIEIQLTDQAGNIGEKISHTIERPEIKAELTADYDGNTLSSGAEITYSLEIENIGAGLLKDIEVYAPIPAGSEYIAGSTIVNGKNIDDINNSLPLLDGLNIANLANEDGNLESGKNIEISYKVKTMDNLISGTEVINQAEVSGKDDLNYQLKDKLSDDPRTTGLEDPLKLRIGDVIVQYLILKKK